MDPQLASDGARAYQSYGCAACHGEGGESQGGTVPDLRASVPASLEHFQVVLGGAMKATGMPAFEVDDETAKSLLAFMVNSAWDAHRMQKRSEGDSQ